MTNLITEARELCGRATPGPWTWRDVTDDSKYFLSAKDLVSEDSLIISAEDIYPGYPECGQDLVLNLSTDDASFISRSRTLIPELCDALEKAQEQNKRLVRELSKLACESAERDRALAKLEAEVMAARDSVREKQERETGCECCQDGIEIAYQAKSKHINSLEAYICLDGNILEADLFTDYMAVKINYCPMCGKRLEVEHE